MLTQVEGPDCANELKCEEHGAVEQPGKTQSGWSAGGWDVD